MAFNIDNFNKVSNTGKSGIPNIWTYEAGTDTQAAVQVSAYFNQLLGNGIPVVQIGDLIYVSAGSDTAYTTYVVTGVSPNIVIAVYTGLGVNGLDTVVSSGKTTWSGSGATLAVTVAGVLATDLVIATFNVASTQGSTELIAAPTTNTVTFTLSTANTSNNAVISWIVYRP